MRYFIFYLSLAIALSGGSSEQEGDIVILASGDTMMGSWAQRVLADSGYAYPFERLQEEIQGTDIFFTNLEAPFGTSGSAFDKKFTFRVNPDLVKVLRAGKINLVSLANNHIMDFGPACLQETMDVLRKNEIQFAGAGMNIKEACRPAILEIKNRKFGFLAYSLTFPEEFWASDTLPGTCFPYEEFVFNDVRKLKENTDFVIVSCHWSAELLEKPKPYQRKLGRRLIDSGADLILGHHPHVVQGIEVYQGKYIVYSLGNFIFGSYSDSARDSFLFKLVLKPDGQTNGRILPINVYNKEVNFRPAPLEGARKAAFIEKMNQLSSELNTGSFGISSEGFLSGIKS